jgi:hypothetical protein
VGDSGPSFSARLLLRASISSRKSLGSSFSRAAARRVRSPPSLSTSRHTDAAPSIAAAVVIVGAVNAKAVLLLLLPPLLLSSSPPRLRRFRALGRW